MLNKNLFTMFFYRLYDHLYLPNKDHELKKVNINRRWWYCDWTRDHRMIEKGMLLTAYL